MSHHNDQARCGQPGCQNEVPPCDFLRVRNHHFILRVARKAVLKTSMCGLSSLVVTNWLSLSLRAPLRRAVQGDPE